MADGEPIVRQIDHVILMCDDKETAQRLFRLFSETYRLPVAWPIEDYPSTHYNPGGFTSGGVFPGNIFIEFLFIGMSAPVRRLFVKRAPRFAAFAYEPIALSQALDELPKRGLAATDPIPYVFDPAIFRSQGVHNIGPPTIEPIATPETLTERGAMAARKFEAFREPDRVGNRTLYKTVWFEIDRCATLEMLKRWFPDAIMPQLFDVAAHSSKEDALSVFLCEFNPLHIDIDAFRANCSAALREDGGGALGISALDELVVTTSDFTGTDEFFRTLLAPLPAVEPGLWRAGASPAVRLEQADGEGISRVVFKVGSLAKTREALAELEMLDADADDHLIVAPDTVDGLSLQFRE